MIYVAFIMFKGVLHKSQHKYLVTDQYYTVMRSAASCCPHPLFWIPSGFCERIGRLRFLQQILLDKNDVWSFITLRHHDSLLFPYFKQYSNNVQSIYVISSYSFNYQSGCSFIVLRFYDSIAISPPVLRCQPHRTGHRSLQSLMTCSYC